MTNPIKIGGSTIEFDDCAEHVGMVRATSGNDIPIFTRISAHKNVLSAILHTGIARGHRGNPVASLRVEQLYGVPVLLSGLAPLVMTKTDEKLVESHHREKLSNLQRLLPCTPRSVILFLAGSLPGSALLHLRKLSICGMICYCAIASFTTMLLTFSTTLPYPTNLGSIKYVTFAFCTIYRTHPSCYKAI